MPLDATLKARSDQLRTARDALLIEVANARQDMLSEPAPEIWTD